MSHSGDLRERRPDKKDDEPIVDEFPAGPSHEPGQTTQRIGKRLGQILIWFTICVLTFRYFFQPKVKITPQSSYLLPLPEDIDMTADLDKQAQIVDAFKHAWRAYEKDAFGSDEYHPISHKGSNFTESGGIGYFIIDSIDTMLLMGLDDEYNRARTWVAEKLSFDNDGNFNTFETTIRVLGGLLSAHHLSWDPMFLHKATDLADRLIVAFDTPTGIPHAMVNLGRREAVPDAQNNNWASTAEAATLQLEFKYLSFLTDNDVYWRAAEKVIQVIKSAGVGGLVPIFIDPATGQFLTSDIRLGSRGDSYYEYLLKQYLQTGRRESVYREMYDEAMAAVRDKLIQLTPNFKLVYTAELQPNYNRQEATEKPYKLVPKQDHLVCFLGGSLLLGVTEGHGTLPVDPSTFSESEKRDWDVGIGLIKTCMATHNTATGLSPEIAHFRSPDDPAWLKNVAKGDWYIKGAHEGITPYDARYILRPETVESLFIAFRVTGNPIFRTWGWRIFQSIEKHCKLPTGGYASIMDVNKVPVEHDDKMETFLMSETFKYLYLLFSDSSVLPLGETVFNTEAHPLPVFNPSIRTGFQ